MKVGLLGKSEELYSRSEKKYRELYENSPALYRTIDAQGIIIDCNKSYAERLGYTKEEVIGKSIFMHSSDDDIDSMKESFETWKRTGNVKNREVWFKTKDGTTFPTLISANNLYDENGILIGSNTIIKDMSETYEARKKIESEAIMRLQFEEIKKMEKLKDEFASMITHELKSPLTPIMGRCEMLKEPGLLGDLNSLQLDSVNNIKKNARRLERLVRDVLEAQKLEMGRMKFDREKINVAEFMTEIHKEYLPLMKEKQIDFVDSTEEKLILTSDKDRIRQVIDNLVLNAADFTNKKEAKIEIGARNEDNKVVFYVKDNGTGIPKEMQPDMFKKFFQADTSLTRKHPGTGLGLVVCKGIVEGLGGKIWFESQSGIGTSFFFTLPKELD
ncbi:MAG TPA: PAS domain-containing sensor histidine kinase [Nitrosopumilaceae archaeon]|nr:PAS domain-containing sensor histidine kinase [Nitrosopumilaceae archaeon]